MLPSAIATAALLAVLSPAGGVWLVVPAAAVLVVVVPRGLGTGCADRGACSSARSRCSRSRRSRSGPRSSTARATARSRRATRSRTSGHPLSGLQVFGIWPAADFRNHPADSPAAYALIAILLVGVVAAGRRSPGAGHAWGIPLYLATGLGGFLVVCGLGHVGLSSPWLNAKAMAEASPAVVAAGVAGSAALLETGRRVEAAVIGSAIAAGVLWSNALAYSNVWLAPRSQLTELESIGKRFAGQGPALMTDTEPYGARHFLRSLDPEGASDRRRRLIPLLGGQGLPKGAYADLDQFQLDGILVYKTLVLARSPSESRPPSVYSLVWSGRYYDVWQRPNAYSPILAHTPLGDSVQPGSVPACSEVVRLAGIAGPSGRLAAPPRVPPVVVDLGRAALPTGWASDAGGHVFPRKGGGAISERFTVPRAGRYDLWIGGSFRSRLRVYIDGRLVADARDRLIGASYEPLGQAALRAGGHRLVLRYNGADLHPGSGGFQFGLGPLILSRGPESLPVTYVPSAAARTLCGRNLDWIEALGSPWLIARAERAIRNAPWRLSSRQNRSATRGGNG